MALSSIGKGIALLARKSQYGTEVADRIARKLSALVEEARRAQAYGPRTCSDLSKVDPSLAIKNAENYRLFCEDAVIFIREGKS
jgi:hypothetical protein